MTKELKNVVTKLKAELEELNNKIINLENFIIGEKFLSISTKQRECLKQQRLFMTGYKECLIVRIADLNQKIKMEGE